MRRIAPYLTARTRLRALNVARRIVRLGREAPDNVPRRLHLEHGLLYGALALLAIASSAPAVERDQIIAEALALYEEIEVSAFRRLLLETLHPLLTGNAWDNLISQLYQRQRDELIAARQMSEAVEAIGTMAAITTHLQEAELRDLITLAMTIDLPYWQ